MKLRMTSGELPACKPQPFVVSEPETPIERRRPRSGRAFSLMEVMIAIGIFFMAVFAILGVVSNALQNARALRQKKVTAGMAAAQLYAQFSLTNQVSEGSGSDDFGDAYPDYTYTYDLYEIESNHLCQLDIIVQRRSGGQPVESKASVLLYLPNLQGGSLSGSIKP
jgi:type II secretory pathway pseudopilin PulG